ncbi:microtubule-associated protein futsch [Stegastes partitus]|uniref:Microtubule-associated protein futsch n=1 Tax=Stegastes partitus TaxID=144197 RepID=A0A9Y4TSQ1_9TELE|nr:PREDICTED: microtubule-associated protein futsch-like [Stegastes partitus]
MGTQGTGRKRSTKKERSTAEDDALNLIAREAEARLAAKRAARAEAREIRMKELERQQKEIFQVQKKYYGLNTKIDDRSDSKWGDIEQWMEDSERYSRSSRIQTLSDEDERMSVGSRGSVRVEDRDYLEKGSRAASALTAGTLTSLGGSSSRRGSGETALTVDAESSIREIKEIHELKDQIQDVESKYTQNLKEVKDTLAEVEEKYRKAMVSNAQLDNEKNNLMYQVDTLKDSLMELEELLSESRREYEEKVKEYEREKYAHGVLQFQFNEMKETLKQSEELLNDIRQLRLKQDGFVREISDLQETVEWKDKKIGALERQKEYTDAIRIERDELREEVVQLKDILKKHGIVLGPDLNINGDVVDAEVDGSPGADPATRSPQDPQTSPTEGNSMLGLSAESVPAVPNTEPQQDPQNAEEADNIEAEETPSKSASGKKKKKKKKGKKKGGAQDNKNQQKDGTEKENKAEKDKYYGLNTKIDDRSDSKWGDIEQWMEDSERYSRSSRIQTLSDEDERMSVGSRGSVRSDLDAVGAYGGGGSSLHKKSKKKKKHKHKDRDRNGYDDDYSVMSSRSSRLSDESRVSRSSRLDLTSSMLGDDSRVSRASRLDLQPASYASSDMYSLSSSRNPGSTFNGYQSSLYEDSLCSGSRRVLGSSSHPLEHTSYRSSGSRASSRASSARASPVDNCSSVASFLRSAASGSGLPRDLDDVTIPDFSDVEDRDYLEKGSRAASALTAGTLTSLGGSSSRRGSGETALTVDAESSIREIKDTLAEVEEKYRKAMVSNAQLDNEKNNLMYQVDTLKDSLMELEELLSESRREYEEKVKEYEREKYAHGVLQFQFNEMKETLKQSEELLNDIRQLRLKQDGFVREISDLQETVEWKDKKIGALERQKEYTDAIRIERDELREEVVQLKDILKKHGIVLGPDLNINGDVVDAEVDGSPGADPATRSPQDPQTSPTEGNSMLGNTEETELRSSREEEVDPEQQQEMLQEVKENHLNSELDSLNSELCNAADVSTKDATSEKQPSEEQQACLPTEEDFTVDSNDNPTTEAKDIIVCSPELHHVQPVTSPEENVPETEIPEGGNLKETTYSDLEQTETKNSSVDTHSDDVRDTDLFTNQDNKQEGVDESNLTNTEPCPQQNVAQDVLKEGLSAESVPAVPNTEPQQGPQNAEEADNIEAEETPSKSASGKKKKKKKKGKKKGGAQDNKNQQKDGTEKENKAEKDVESAARSNGATAEPKSAGPVTESKVDQVENEQDKRETEEVDAVEPAEPTQTFSNTEGLQEPRTDDLSNEHDEKQTSETKTLEDVEVVNPSDHVADGQNEEQTSETKTLEDVEVVNPSVVTMDHVADGQNEEQTETVESVEAVEPTAETLKESTTDSKKDEDDGKQTSEMEKEEEEERGSIPSCDTETNLCKSDLNSNNTESTDGLDTKTISSVDNFESKVLQTKSETVEEVESVDEMKSECTADTPENGVETSSKENTEAESSNDDVAANESESINNPDSKDDASVSLPSTEDFNEDLKSSSESDPPAAIELGSDDPPRKDSDQAPEEAAEAVADDGEAGAETEQEGFHQDRTGSEELNGDLKEPGDSVEPDISSHDEKSDGNKTSSLTSTTEVLDSGESVEAAVQDEQLNDAESKISEYIDEAKESKTKDKTEETDANAKLDTPQSQSGSGIEQETGVPQDSEHKDTQHVKESESSLCSLDEQPNDSQDKHENSDSSRPTQLLSDEDDGEDEEGMSFDFDEMDMEAAVESELSKNSEQEEVELGVEVVSDETVGGSLELCQSNTQSNENTQVKPAESNDDKCTVDGDKQVDALDENSNPSLVNVEAAREEVENVCEEREDKPKEEAGVADDPGLVAEEGEVSSVGGLAVVAENIKQTVFSLVEEGLDAVRHELHGEDVDLPKGPVQEVSNQEAPQPGKDGKKSSKKGKGKGKEDCKIHPPTPFTLHHSPMDACSVACIILSPLPPISLAPPTPEIRLRKLVDEREKMIEQVKKLKAQLEQKTQKNGTDASSPDGEIVENGNDPNIMEIQRDSNRQISDLKFKLVKAEQEVTALEQNVTRLEGQVTRYKSASENSEKVEDELKAEKRKLQRELRSALDKIDELESNNSHLSKRLEKMKSSRGMAQTP